MDDVAAFASRFLPNPTTAEQHDDVKRSIKSVYRNYPSLIAELGRPKEDGRYVEGGGVLAANGPIMSSVMTTFAARMVCPSPLGYWGDCRPGWWRVCAMAFKL
ncbi:hypothetical protein NKH98_31975 [Mesorhizobium sp. M0833]|uniref:hypothetical protein n=1 Tax=Mesorhizobium sp. M0833 TaxID=2957009 RepID=UPI0033381D8F